ncbi:MAG: Cof-type HAD-IIB family hydrolase [Cardiobacteriaceae bacterium]|nr:Cof-type HAD-IIB family hydrolase [Cardiobacteriaceae bacterium]
MDIPVRAVFFDIDRTLYEHSNDYIPPSSLAAIATLKARGIIPAIATGRGYCALPPAIANLVAHGDIELVVSSNGQYNRYGTRVLSAHPLSRSDLESLSRAFRKRDWEFTFVSATHMAAGRSRGSGHRILKNYPCYCVAPSYYREHDVHQMIVLVPVAEEATLQEIMAEHDNRYKTVRSHAGAVDLLHAEGSKARGILEACSILAIDPQQTLAFGDGLNDMEMFGVVGRGIAMGDACDELKAVATHVTGTLEENGIQQALERLGII